MSREHSSERYSFEAEVWEWSAKNSWFFLSVPEDDADDIEERYRQRAAGFGSIRVEVTIGSSTWRTSLFPSTEQKTYVLPLKKVVRTAEGIELGSTVAVDLVVVTD